MTVTLTPAARRDYERKWKTCEVDYQKTAVMGVARRVLAVKKTCSGFWNVPWWFVALCWLRECNLNPKGSLAQGDLWNKKSTHVPKNRGPFNSWREAAEDALKLKRLHVATDWGVASVLFRFEEYNGFGYHNKGVPSPYLWSHTNHYADGSWDNDPKGGKYYADHKWSPDIYDPQIGVCAVLKCLIELDPTIEFGSVKIPPPPDIEPPKPKAPTDVHPTESPETKPLGKSRTFWGSITAALAVIWSAVQTALETALTDWRVWLAIVALIALAYIIWERNNKPDIRGWFR